MIGKPLMTLAAVAMLGITTGCAAPGLSAAPDVHRFLVSVRNNDRAAFNAYVDRRALEDQLRGRIVQKAAASSIPEALKPFSILLAGPLSRAAGDILIRPDVFRWVAESYGYRTRDPLPSTLSLSVALKPISDNLVCAKERRDGPCLLTFANEQGTWRLVSFDGDMDMLGDRRR